MNVFHAVHPQQGADYPCIRPEMCLFIMMTEGTGTHDFRVEVVTWEDDEETSIWLTRQATMELGQDPLHVFGWLFWLHELVFPHPGLYEFRLLCDGQIVAREPIRLREAP
jgi:hypothetical protein